MTLTTTSERAPSTATPRGVLASIVHGINAGDLASLMPLYERDAAFATEPGTLDLEVTRVLEVDDLALVIGVWSFDGTAPDGTPVRLEAKNADVLRRQSDGSWRFVIDNPWGTD